MEIRQLSTCSAEELPGAVVVVETAAAAAAAFFFLTSCSADLISSRVTPWVLRLVSRTLFAWAFRCVSDSSSRTGGTIDLEAKLNRKHYFWSLLLTRFYNIYKFIYIYIIFENLLFKKVCKCNFSRIKIKRIFKMIKMWKNKY